MKLCICIFAVGTIFCSAEPIRGKLFHVDPVARSFDLLKETEYDPKTDLTKSRYPCQWKEDAPIRKILEVKSFSKVSDPIWTTFRGIDAKNQAALNERKPFVARVAIMIEGTDKKAATSIAENEVSGWFTPTDEANSRGGSILIDGTPVPVRLRERNWRIWHHALLEPKELAEGFWQAELSADSKDGTLFVTSIDATALPDPRISDDSRLPRVLVIGDSISMNYHEAAKKSLAGIANYHRNDGNSFSTEHGVVNTELWLGDYAERGLHWDVIQFNHGLHDLKQRYDAATKTWGAYAVPLEDYKANLEKQIAILRKTGAKLIWCTTTPIPNDNLGTYARRKGAADIFNAAALEVMKRHPDILINDLYSVIQSSPKFDPWRQGTDVHFYQEEEKKLLGEAVASAVQKALAREPKKLPIDGLSFTIAGSQAFIIQPAEAKRSVPAKWVWYAPTLPGLPGKAEGWVFQQLLEQGVAIAGIDVGESMGNPAGRAKFTTFYREMVDHKGFAAKPCLLARSRGGLMLYNWAVENPECVSGIAGIYPVGNLASWPGLEKASRAYGWDQEQLAGRLSEHNPVDRLAPLAKQGVPILHLHGDNDKVVPLEANSGLLHQRYIELGGPMTLKVIPSGGHDMEKHWFHSQELVGFLVATLKNTGD